MLQLKSGGVKEIGDALKVAQNEDKLISISSNFYYGNMENLLDLLKARMRTGEHIEGHRSLTVEERSSLAKEAKALLDRLDGLLVILAALRQDGDCLRAYRFRLVLTVVVDYLEDLSNSSNAPPPRTYAPISTTLASASDRWFTNCRKVLDRRHKSQLRWSYIDLLASLPKIAFYRLIVRRWKRLRGHPYLDPFSSNFVPLFINALAKVLENTWNEIIVESGVDKKRLQLMKTQHVSFSEEQCVVLLVKIRPLVTANKWNKLLATTLITEIDSRVISISTVDSFKAQAIYYLTALASKDEGSNNIIEQAFKNLWNLHSTPR